MPEPFSSIDDGAFAPARHLEAAIARLERIALELRDIARVQHDYGCDGAPERRQDMFWTSGQVDDWASELSDAFNTAVAYNFAPNCDAACDARREDALS